MEMTAVLKVLDVACAYDSVGVLEGVTFSVGRGEFTGIIGPNGSGKTTLLKTISQILRPVRGVVLLSGEELSKIKPGKLARQMAVVPQETVVNFPFTVRDIVLMGRSPYLKRFQSEGPRDFEVVRRAMQITATDYLADRLITALSGGERQRVIIARALAQEPEILLLDEPTAHLDINNQVEILNLLRFLSRERGLTVIAVFHDLNLAAQYCDRLILLRKGKIYRIGGPEEVVTAENIRKVYGASVLVRRDRITGALSLTPVWEASGSPAGRPAGRVHVFGGGGAGSPIMSALVKKGFVVSAGVLNIGDVDWEVAKELGLEVVEEAPFSPISAGSYEKNLELVLAAGACILAEIPFGYGNIKNLESALVAVRNGKSVLVVETGGCREKRDYTRGEAQKIYEAVKKEGGRTLRNLEDVIFMLNDCLQN